MNTTTITCPVCGAGPKMQNGQVRQDCPACSTPSAFAVYFASAEGYQTWLADMRSRANALRSQNIRQLRSRGRLIVGPESVALLDTQKNSLLLLNQHGKGSVEQKVQQYSVSNLHQVLLKTNGTIAASGDVAAQQGLLAGRKGAKAVLAAPRCTYVVNGDGTVSAFGVCSFADEVGRWTNIKSLVCGKDHVVGLKEDGTLVLASSKEKIDRSPTGWSNVKTVAAAADYTLGLHENGRVSYAGSKQDIANEVARWTNIVDIAADSQYAVGLTEDGQVLLAGKVGSILDCGRSEARNWKNVVCIGSGINLIAGITADGELLLAGICTYRDALINGFNQIKNQYFG